MVHAGMIGDGTRHEEPVHMRGADDFSQAAECFKLAAKIAKDGHIQGPNATIAKDGYIVGEAEQYAHGAKESAKTARELRSFAVSEASALERSGVYVGAWVIVLGLQSAAGSALNRKLGRVSAAPTRADGRFAVQVDGVSGAHKLLKADNMKPLTPDAGTRALMACLERNTAWEFGRTAASRAIEAMDDGMRDAFREHTRALQ